MASDLEHWNINATVFKDRVEEVHVVNDPARNIRRQQQTHTWHIGQFLGRGGFGEVRLQRDQENGKARAVKRITMIGNVLSKSECEKELEALMEFSKPKFKDAACFVEFYGWFTDGPEMFLAMEFVQLGDLEKNVARSGKIPVSEARDIAAQILFGLEIMHTMKFAHRDLKPQNIMVVNGPPHWWIKLADFGLSKRLTETTGYHTRIGTQSYMAPELLNYVETDIYNPDYTDAIDLWATGCIVYRLVAGVVPFPPGTFLMKYCEDKSLFPYDRLIDSGVTSGVVSFLRETLATSIRERPSASQALQHMWIKTVSNNEKQSLSISRASPEAATSSLSELTISDIGYNTASHDGLKSEAEAKTPSRTEIRPTHFPSASPSYNTQNVDFSSQNTVVKHFITARRLERKSVATYLSPEQINASIDNGESEVGESPGRSQGIIEPKTTSTMPAKIPTKKQQMQPTSLNKTSGNALETFDSYGPDTSVDYRLLYAIGSGNIATVQLLLDQGAKIDAANLGSTPLCKAVSKGHLSIVQLLLDRGANIEAADKEGWMPLHGASYRGYLAIVQLLLDKEANIEAATQSWRTPLYLASSKGHLAIVQLLLDQGANIEAANLGSTPLYEATSKGHLAIVRLLLDRGANIEAADKGGWMPLHEASYRGYLAIVQLLLDKEANIEAATKSWRTPLYLASSKGHLAVVQLLLDKGANIEAATKSGQTPLHGASFKGHLAIVQLLLDKGANIEAASKDERTPLYLALSEEHLAIVQLLFDKGANIEAADIDGCIPLGLASYNGHLDIVQLLLEKGANIEATDKNGEKPLCLASVKGHLAIVQLLLDKGANIEAANLSGWTPLSLASYYKKRDIIELLLERGADASRIK